MNARTGINVVTVCSTQCRSSAWLSKWLFFVMRTDIAIPDLTLRALWKVLKWAFDAMRTGRYPAHDHLGAPWVDGTKRARQAGHFFAAGLRFVYAQSISDMKWEKEVYEFEAHFNREDVCHLCKATKSAGPCCYTHFDDDAGWLHQPRTHDEFLAGPGSGNPLCHIVGWHLSTVLPDMMHILGLGILQVAVGSTLRELCASNYWGAAHVVGGWKVRFDLQLKLAYTDFIAYCSTTSQAPFTVNMLSMKNLSSFPLFKGKAANTMVVSCWLARICKEIADRTNTEHDIARATMWWGFMQSIALCKESGQFLSDDTADKLMECRECALLGFNHLALEAERTGAALWPVRPKLHRYDHMIRSAAQSKLNPAFYWCFVDEDMNGKLKRLGIRAPNAPAMVAFIIRRYTWLFAAIVRARAG